ncbi:orphan sodium- and chloride-dependent neurotransmitter transporter NTT5 [Dasypus novemcinctus]|uniref:orphan sodium- and chloride-dependent neurotransmitter transporter NTT5 n=1 Tax=Dasypus novemcinctus TaxID=9361 RepID=UPI00265F600B|nr:orphan sodium- and chloride-dependent neurotransmitter transporter NTT5 [Dasypus novemcinctus]XP_058136550.1 orphan sodium- and chloride-dependent neurotransmitter transporter NTT5 [Dasypus novemcinctus]
MPGAWRAKRRAAHDRRRSTQEGNFSLAEDRAAPVKTESQSSESLPTKTLSAETKLSENASETRSWGTKTWSATALVSEAWAAQAEAWETQAQEAQSRMSHFKQTSAGEMEAASDLNKEPSAEKMQVTEKEEDEVLPSRPFWSNKIDYILAQAGYTLKPFTLWRLPHLWLHNGGSFFIIYVLMLFLIGIPLLFLEMAAGQGLRQSSLGAWKVISPWIGGLGYASFMVCLIVGLYFSAVTAWNLFYLGESIQNPVPWERCPLLKNSSGFDPECLRTTPATYFWYRRTLEASDSIDGGGPPVFHLSVPLFLFWFLIGSIMINGLKSTGKAMYILVLSPYFIIFSLLIRSLLLDGALFGLQHLVVVKISAVYSINVWHQVGIHVLLALGLGFGTIASFSSYMPQSNNCLSDAFAVVLVNLGTILLVIPAIFSVLGFWATVIIHRCNERNAELLIKLVAEGVLPPEARPPVSLHGNPTAIFTSWLNGLPPLIKSMVLSKVSECDIQKQILKVQEGPNFVFLAFIEALALIPGSDLWSIFFFLLMVNLRLSTMVGIMQGIITPLQDTFSFPRKHPKLLTVCVSVLMFLGSLFFIRPPGFYYIRMLDYYWSVLPIVTIIIFENIAVAWAYGARRFLEDLKIMVGHPIPPIYRWLWCYLSPFVLLVLFITSLIYLCVKPIIYVAWDSSTSSEVLRQYPPWTIFLMAILFVIVILPIPTYCMYYHKHGVSVSPETWNESISFKSLPVNDQVIPSREIQGEKTLKVDKTS